MRHAASLLGLAVAGLVTGCPDRSISEVNPLQGRVEAKDIPVKINRKVDILFLIDNSPSMRDKQQNLADNFPKFIDVLDSIQGGGPDALKTVFATMAKVGDTGCPFEQHLEGMKRALQPTNAANRGFLRPDAFLAIIFIADEDDCSFEHSSLITADTSQLGPLLSMRCTRYGITCDTGGATPDDMYKVGAKGRCHPNEAGPLTKIADYVTFLKNLKSDDPSKVIVAGIMGPTEPVATELRLLVDVALGLAQLAHSCQYIGGDGNPEVADPAIRLRFFLDQFPNRSTFAPICQRDLSGGLQQIGELLKTVIGDPCIEGKLADADPDTPGPQYDLSLSAVTNRGLANQTQTVLPHCEPDSGAASNKPCWRIATDTNLCAAGDHLTLRIEGQDTLPQDTHVVANCVTEVTSN